MNIPQLLILDITHRCNLNCRICEIWKTSCMERDIDIVHVKKMLYQARELNIQEIALSGGEPLLRGDIFEIIRYAQKIKIKNLGILTNGILVNRYFDTLKPFLVDQTIGLVISLDSLRPMFHNYIRNSRIVWQETKEALHKLALLKKDQQQINFNVITIILKGNLEELLDIANFVELLCANSLQFQALLPNNLKMNERRKSEFWITEEQLSVMDKSLDDLIVLKKRKPNFIKNSRHNLFSMKAYYRNEVSPGSVRCLSGYRTILVSNNGECRTCFDIYGNLKTTLLRDVLLSQKIMLARTEVEKCQWPCLLPCFCD